MTLAVLVATVAVQLAACTLALMLVRFERQRAGWFVLSLAFLAMAVRRLMAVDDQVAHWLSWLPALPVEDLLALGASLLVLAGVFLMRPFFRRADEDSISATRLAVARQASEEKYRFVVENIHDALVVIAEDRVVFASPAFTGIFGLASEDIVGRGLSNLVAAEYRQLVGDALSTRGGRDSATTSAEARIVRTDGTNRWVRIVAYPAKWDRQPAVVCLVTDVTEQRAAEAALRESEARYRAIVEDQTELVCRFRPDGVLTFANSAFCRFFERAPALIVGSSLLDTLPASDRSSFLSGLHSLGAAAPARVTERRMVAPSGQLTWQQWTERAILDEAGDVTEIQAVGRDITQRVIAEDALRSSEERYRRMFGANNAIRLLITPDTGAIIDANPAACGFYGYPLERMRRLDLADISTGTRSEIAHRLAIARLHETSVFQLATRLADGTVRNIEVHISPVEVHGRAYLYSVVHDVTERAQAEAARDRSLRYLRAAAEVATQLLMEPDVDASSQRVVATLGLAAEADRCYWFELRRERGTPPRLSRRAEWCAPGVPSQLAESPLQDASVDSLPPDFLPLCDDEVVSREVDQLSSDARRLLAPFGITSILLIPLHGEGGLRGVIGFDSVRERRWREEEVDLLRAGAQSFSLALDRTEHEQQSRALEESLFQTQKMEALGTLASGIAHDFGNVATIIAGAANLLDRQCTGPGPEHGEIAVIRRAADSAAELTRGLLAFARRQVIEPVVLDVADVVRDTLPMVRRLIPEDIEIRSECGGDGGWVRADRSQVQQALINLCVNARDAMPDGGTLTVAIRRVTLDDAYVAGHPWARQGEYVGVSVKDTGCGIDPTTLTRVLDPFFTTKRPGKGTGLGLAIVYGIAKQHGGLVDIDSEVGRGTNLEILLPTIDGPLPGAAPRPKEGERRIGGQEHILVVEDHPDLRGLVVSYLAMLGYRLSAAADGEEALAVMREGSPRVDGVITDLDMPRMGGLELTGRIRAEWPDVALVIATGFAETSHPQSLADLDRVALVPKPYELDGLAEKLRAVLDRGAGDDGGHAR